jgi:hypothetical protein
MIIIPSSQSRPATAKVSIAKFKELGIAPGEWVQIDTLSLKVLLIGYQLRLCLMNNYYRHIIVLYGQQTFKKIMFT